VKLTDDKRRTIEELAQAVNNDLTEAIIYFEVSRCSAATVKRFNSARAPEGLSVITFALPLAAAAALCRIWDKPRTAASITSVAGELKSEGQTDAAVARWRKRVEEIAASEDVKAARDYRHQRLAHHSRPNDTHAVTVDEADVLDLIVPRLLGETIAVVETLNGLLGLKFRWSLRETQENWRDRAADFWRIVAQPCA
jgi:hypothetical protein